MQIIDKIHLQKKRIGPRTVPWGIPDRTGDQFQMMNHSPLHIVFYHLICGLEEEPWGGSVKGLCEMKEDRVDLTTVFKNACSLMNDLN